MNFIALDIGSTSIKATAWDLAKLETIGDTIRVPCPAPLPDLPTGHFELDPAAVVSTAHEVITSILSDVADVAGIVSCNQMAGVILADHEGNPLSNYLSWRDQRVLELFPGSTRSYYDLIHEHLTPKRLQQLGHECKPGSALSLLFWLRENGQLPDAATPLMLGDYVAMQIAQADPVTEYTNSLGALNLETGDWHTDACQQLGLDTLSWPQLGTPYTPIGAFTIGNRTIPWYPSVGDHQCALAGTLLKREEISINASTGSQVSLLSPHYQPGDYQVRPYFDGQYLNTLTHLPAGRSLNVLVDLLGELAHSQGIELADPWSYIMKAVDTTDTDLATELTFFAGPLGERGNISNISVDNLTVGALFQAAFRNMADNYETCTRRLTSGQRCKTLVLSGGLVQRCHALREMITNRLKIPARVCPTEEETFQGLLVIALAASGQADSLAAATAIVADAHA